MLDENKKLAMRLKKHDEDALDRIILKFAPLVTAIINNITGRSLTREDVEETVSDVFVDLWNGSDRFDPDHLQGYICSIARFKAIDLLTKQKNSPILLPAEEDIEDNFSLHKDAEMKEMARTLREVIDFIGEPDREILIRHYFCYQKINDISRAMDIPPSTVKVKLHRTRNKLKKLLAERGFTL